MNSDDSFPVLWPYSVARGDRTPSSVPWAWVEGFATRLNRNHGQTVKRLAERGGLDPTELWCGAFDKGLWDDGVPDLAAAVAWLRISPWAQPAPSKGERG